MKKVELDKVFNETENIFLESVKKFVSLTQLPLVHLGVGLK